MSAGFVYTARAHSFGGVFGLIGCLHGEHPTGLTCFVRLCFFGCYNFVVVTIWTFLSSVLLCGNVFGDIFWKMIYCGGRVYLFTVMCMNKKTIAGLSVVIVAVLLTAGVLACQSDLFPPNDPTVDPGVSVGPGAPVDPEGPGAGQLQVIVFDVGQADCTLLKMDGHAMLIDAGNTGQDKLVLNYLAEYGITTLDYLVATHPHADHIGSMTSVVNAMDSIGTVLMPDKPHTTKTYLNLITAIENKDIPLTIPTPGEVFQWGDATVEVLAPNSPTYKDLNDYSIVLRVEFGETSFLFTGDAGTISENEQLAVAKDSLKSDVLKVGHHGSRTSSTQKYLNAVAPSYAVICCGADNDYGHPHTEAMTRLTGTGATIYRTDLQSTIIFTTDGKDITVSVSRGPPITDDTTTPPPQPDIVYIGNKNTKTFHKSTCGSLPAEQNRITFNTRQEAIDAGYTPCGSCKP